MSIRRLSELAFVLAVGLRPAVASAAPPASAAPSANDDPFADFRERFKQGMDRYKAGAFTEAVGYWEPIYGELGEQRGYRLAYNLGVAYEQLGDATRAAERLEAFVAQVDAKRARGEDQPAIVQKEETDATERLAALKAAKGRIHIDPGSPPKAVQVDAMPPRLAAFVAWVNPGQHTVTFAPGSPMAESRSVEVRAGELLELSPTPAPAPVPAPVVSTEPATTPTPQTSTAARGDAGTGADVVSMHHETVRPFPAALLFVGGGLTLSAGIASVPLESNAWSLRDRYAKESPIPASDSASFTNARSWAYGMIGATAALGVITAALVTWYFAGSVDREVFVTPGGAGVAGRF